MISDETKVIVSRAVKNKLFRKNLVKESLFWFLHIYFPDYLTYPIADFHKEIIKLVEENKTNLAIAAFRGSGKSTIVSTAAVIWSMIGLKEKRFIVLISNTARQSEILMANIKAVLESNDILKADLGPFEETAEEWNISSLVFKDYDTKIMAISVNESVRGIRYKNKRPDLIVCDDVETLDSVKTEDNRDKLTTWFDRDIVPLGDESTNFIMVGTIMTQGSLMHTLKERIDFGQLNGVFRKYPITDEDGNILWKSLWPDQESIDKYKLDKGIVPRSWQTEYLLNDYAEEDQLIKQDMIETYTEIPFGQYPGVHGFISVDLAISTKESADKTAILAGYMLTINGKEHLYLLPHPVNKRMNSHDTLIEIKNMALSMDTGTDTTIIIENVGYQSSMIEQLEQEGFYNAVPFEIRGQDKRARLETTIHNLVTKRILFPEKGCDTLINQLVMFGIEKYDDLADAFSMLSMKSFEIGSSPKVIMVRCTGLRKDIFGRSDNNWDVDEDDRMLRGRGRNWRRIMG